ncbi:hypothetical protein SDJN03_02987, partial [Cucurbita argyrosperma subsp. sororia]
MVATGEDENSLKNGLSKGFKRRFPSALRAAGSDGRKVLMGVSDQKDSFLNEDTMEDDDLDSEILILDLNLNLRRKRM